jgi:tripartite ATP-independent transporter DctM subunit
MEVLSVVTVETSEKNWLNKAIHYLGYIGIFSRWTNWISMAIIFVMTMLTFVDVIARYVFNSPILGVLEITSVMMICAVSFGIAYAQDQKCHVGIDLISATLKPRARVVLEFIVNFMGLAMFVIFVRQTIIQTFYYAYWHLPQGKFAELPRTPFAAIIVIGGILLSLILLRDLLRNVNEARELRCSLKHWILMFSIPVCIVVLTIFWMQPTLMQMSLLTVGLIGSVVSIILFLTGMPASFCMIIAGFVFIGHIRGNYTALDTLSTLPYSTMGSYLWSVVIFFTFMGFLIYCARFGEDLYRAAYKWLGHIKGGLAIATIGGCAAMAAIIGDGTAVAATMTSVSLPEMRKYRYSDILSTGSIIGGSTLGPIIPPSTLFIIYGLLTQVSIGKLFIAGIIPGILFALIFAVVIYIWCRRNPHIGPPGPKETWGARVSSLSAGGPVVVLFLLVIGGLYAGVFTPLEGGGIGCVGAIILALLYKRLNWQNFTKSLLETSKVVSFVFLLIVGAQIFAQFTAWCNISDQMTKLVTGASLPPLFIVFLIEVVLFLLGFAIDPLPLILIAIPVLHPVIVAMGVDPIWFAVVTCLNINLAVITPPQGIILFTVKTMAKDVPISTIFKGAMPFVYATIAGIALCWFIPSLITWLPNLLK